MVARVVVTLIGLVDFGLAVDVQSWQGELDLQAGEDAWILKANHGQCKAPWHAVTICWEYEPQNAEYLFNGFLSYHILEKQFREKMKEPTGYRYVL